MANLTCVKIFIISIILLELKHLNANDADKDKEAGYCELTDDGVQCVSPKKLRLARLNGGEVGDVTDVEVDDGRVLKLRTISTKPLVIEIEDFLQDEECEHFMSVAKETGLMSSHTEKQSFERGITLMDTNQDKQLSLDEMKLTIENSFDMYLDEKDILDMYAELALDTNNDTFITQTELKSVKPRDFSTYLSEFISNNPEKHSRFSKQTWIFPDSSTDDVFTEVQKRVSKVTQLPMGLIRLSDFQVVTYGVQGHYNAHIDSSHIDPKVPCCDRGKSRRCRLCRYMTILFYLNKVGSGGETAFPVANNETLDQTKINTHGVKNLFRKCEDANLRVPAQKGKAIIWYSHFVDEETGWMGDIDEFTLHGGCPVTEGEKWIANFWIKTTTDKLHDIERMKQVNINSRQKDEL